MITFYIICVKLRYTEDIIILYAKNGNVKDLYKSMGDGWQNVLPKIPVETGLSLVCGTTV